MRAETAVQVKERQVSRLKFSPKNSLLEQNKMQ
jgi:hypothetical protein